MEDGREKAKFDIDKGKSHYYTMITHKMAIKQCDLSCQFYGDSKITDRCCIKLRPIYAILGLLSKIINLECAPSGGLHTFPAVSLPLSYFIKYDSVGFSGCSTML